MSKKDGVISERRKEQARQHNQQDHTCPECHTVKYGNGFYTHLRACILRKYPDLAGWPARDMRKEYWRRKHIRQ